MRTIYRDIVGGFILSEDKKILLGKSKRGTYEGCWIIPGGGVEEGETEKVALRRELMEEIGIDIAGMKVEKIGLKLSGESPKRLKQSGEEVLGKYNFINFIVRAPYAAREIRVEAKDDFAEATWFALEELPSLKLPPPSIQMLRHIGLLR